MLFLTQISLIPPPTPVPAVPAFSSIPSFCSFTCGKHYIPCAVRENKHLRQAMSSGGVVKMALASNAHQGDPIVITSAQLSTGCWPIFFFLCTNKESKYFTGSHRVTFDSMSERLQLLNAPRLYVQLLLYVLQLNPWQRHESMPSSKSWTHF